ncbi:MAG TPA: Crp/Fnr family transcriptional regulator [Terracidiphilus sp.]|nr:Crp/Fnr family transcriptional regulator [Terracidiphilus sp.]
MPGPAQFGYSDAAARPLAELLACPPAVANLLNASAESIECDTGSVIFRQGDPCLGLYLVISGRLLRKAERFAARLTLGAMQGGGLAELAAALGDGRHTYSLVAQAPSSLLMLRIDTLHRAFQAYPPLRMQLLQELAREVSRCYLACTAARFKEFRRSGGNPLPRVGR